MLEGRKRKARGVNRSRLKHTGNIQKGRNKDKEKLEGIKGTTESKGRARRG